MILTAEQIQQLLHGNKSWQDWVEPIQKLLPQYGIDTADRIAMFFAQCGHESLNFKVLEENLNYSAKGLNAVFPKYFERAGRDAEMYHRNPERIANVVYANRMGNGDYDSGEGWLYRGRGVIQLTGKNNYSAFAAAIGKSLGETIAYLETKEGALESACWFWNMNNISEYADAQDIKGATKRINGGYNGLEDRKHHYEQALAILGGEYIPTPRPTLIKLGSKGDDVAAVQAALGLDADGHFGKLTEAAVIAWQANNGLTPDGIVGPKTYAKIMA